MDETTHSFGCRSQYYISQNDEVTTLPVSLHNAHIMVTNYTRSQATASSDKKYADFRLVRLDKILFSD